MQTELKSQFMALSIKVMVINWQRINLFAPKLRRKESNNRGYPVFVGFVNFEEIFVAEFFSADFAIGVCVQHTNRTQGVVRQRYVSRLVGR